MYNGAMRYNVELCTFLPLHSFVSLLYFVQDKLAQRYFYMFTLILFNMTPVSVCMYKLDCRHICYLDIFN